MNSTTEEINDLVDSARHSRVSLLVLLESSRRIQAHIYGVTNRLKAGEIKASPELMVATVNELQIIERIVNTVITRLEEALENGQRSGNARRHSF